MLSNAPLKNLHMKITANLLANRDFAVVGQSIGGGLRPASQIFEMCTLMMYIPPAYVHSPGIVQLDL